MTRERSVTDVRPPRRRSGAPAAVLALALLAAGCGGGGEYRLRQVASDPAGGGDATIAPDGRSFVASSRREGGWDVWIHELDTGRWRRVTDHPADDFEARFTPDGGRLVFTTTRDGDKDLWVKDLVSGGERRLARRPDDDEYPAVSRDGRRAVFTGGPWEARSWYVLDLDAGDGARPLAVNREPSPAGGACTFDPSGESLVCHRYAAGTGDLFRLWLADGAIVPLTADDAWDYKPAASPDGRWIAFSRSLDGPADIWLLETATGRTRPLVASPWEDRWPTWSADGERLFFHRIVDRGTAVRRLDPGRAAGGGEGAGPAAGELLVGPEESPLQADLDPSGEWLVYCFQDGDGRALRLRHLPSRSRRELPTGPGEACYPRFSPDGRRIAFATHRGRRWEVATIARDGSDLRLLTTELAGVRGMDGPLDWSPDGRRIVFHADTAPFEADLFTVEEATGQFERLTSDPWFDEAPAYTPDGDVVFMSTRGGGWTWSLYRLSPGDGVLERLVGPDYVEKNFPRQAADGSLVWSRYGEDGRERLALRRPSGEVEELAGTAGARWASWHAGTRGVLDTVLYTTVEHTVEYWLVDHPLGRGSPWFEGDDAPAVPEPEGLTAALASASQAAGPPSAAGSPSPVDKERR